MTVPVQAVLPDSRLAPSQILAKFQVHSMAGLGACGDQITDPVDGTITYDTASCTGANWPTPVYTPPSNPIDTLSQPALYPNADLVAAPGTSSSWIPVVSALIKSGMTLAQIQALHPGMTVAPNGIITYQNPGYPIGTTGISSGIGLFTGSSGILIIAAIAAVVLLGSHR